MICQGEGGWETRFTPPGLGAFAKRARRNPELWQCMTGSFFILRPRSEAERGPSVASKASAGWWRGGADSTKLLQRKRSVESRAPSTTLLRKMVPQADIFVGHTGNVIRKIEP